MQTKSLFMLLFNYSVVFNVVTFLIGLLMHLLSAFVFTKIAEHAVVQTGPEDRAELLVCLNYNGMVVTGLKILLNLDLSSSGLTAGLPQLEVLVTWLYCFRRSATYEPYQSF